MVFDILQIIIHLVILLICPPFFLGIIAKIKAIFAGRSGPSLFQVYYDLFKLFKKGIVRSKSSSFITNIVPVSILSLLIIAGLLLPIIGKAPINFEGDVIFFIYLLAFTRFLLIIGALDVGSSFEGLGGSREAAFGAFSELSLFTGLATLAIITHSLSLSEILAWGESHSLFHPAIVLLFISFMVLLLTENSRMPVDDPQTHLELTMIHEVMILDYSGKDLSFILYGSSIKLFIFMIFTSSFIWPAPENFTVLAVPLLFLKVTGIAIIIGIVESVTSRIRLAKIPQLLIANFGITLLALLVSALGGQSI